MNFLKSFFEMSELGQKIIIFSNNTNDLTTDVLSWEGVGFGSFSEAAGRLHMGRLSSFLGVGRAINQRVHPHN